MYNISKCTNFSDADDFQIKEYNKRFCIVGNNTILSTLMTEYEFKNFLNGRTDDELIQFLSDSMNKDIEHLSEKLNEVTRSSECSLVNRYGYTGICLKESISKLASLISFYVKCNSDIHVCEIFKVTDIS